MIAMTVSTSKRLKPQVRRKELAATAQLIPPAEADGDDRRRR
jgi:hypothetical protein